MTRVEQTWSSLRDAINNETEEAVGSKQVMKHASIGRIHDFEEWEIAVRCGERFA